jgi:amino acid adenylation domain-containing protein/non-ribosomal peptide synthase protein (TIGR01720 family)
VSGEVKRTETLSAAKRELLSLLLKKRGVETQARPEEIRRRTGGGPCPLSFAQERLWFFEQLEPGTAVYHIANAVRLAGRLDAAALARALGEIVRRHESLRTVFSSEAGTPVQIVLPELAVELPVTDLSGLAPAERAAEAVRLSDEESRRPFDFARGPLLRCRLLRLAEEEHLMLLTVHHIVADGWSMGVLVGELSALYEAFAAGGTSPLAELPVQYADFAAWQRATLQGEELERQLDYWRTKLGDPPDALDLPTDRPRASAQTFSGAREAVVLSEELSASLRELSRREGTTLFILLLAAFKTLLYRYTSQEDIAVGTPVANRSRLETEALIGLFANTLVLRTHVSGQTTFRELLGRVRETALGAYAHQDVPFEKLVAEFQPDRTSGVSPLFQVLFAVHPATARPIQLSSLKMEQAGADRAAAKFDLFLAMSDEGSRLTAAVEYKTDLFDAATVRRMLTNFEVLLEGIAADPDQLVARLPLLTDGERGRLLVGLNRTGRDYPPPFIIHELFRAQAARTPQAPALIHGNEQLTYAELDSRSDELARRLRALGAAAEAPVAVLLERTPALVVALLGVLKSGSAYVPLDAQYPRERLSFMLSDSAAGVVVTQQSLLGVLPEHAAHVLCLDDADSTTGGLARPTADAAQPEAVAPATAAPPAAAPAAADLQAGAAGARPDNLAYVIYTSGSTGKPKGVAISHRSASVLLRWAHDTFPAEVFSRTLASTSVCFDLSVFELFAPLTSGGAVVLAQDALALPALAARDEVTLVNTVPSAMAELVRSDAVPASVRAVCLAGEALKQSLSDRLYALGVPAVWNLYGPSEDTTYSTAALCREGRRPPIGRPVANTRAYVLDRWQQPVPEGAAGELYLAGDGLARGYLNRAGLTAERFVPDPYGEVPGGRMYRTGDVARYDSAGELEYLGRSDQQVKVRGYRIELGEVEAALASLPGVKGCAVTAPEGEGGVRRLVAYVVAEEGAGLDAAEARRLLGPRLPGYMIPGAFVWLEELPLTPNGKVDRKRLPRWEAKGGGEGAEGARPQTEAERVLASIWEEVLGVAEVCVEDNFFELGGDSILTLRVVARANQEGLRLTPRQMFKHQTIASLASVIDTAPAAQAEQGEVTGEVPLTPIQHWLFGQDLPEVHHYNMGYLFEARERLDASSMKECVRALLAHHDAWRLRFERVGSGWRQFNAAAGDEIPFESVDVSGVPEEELAGLIEAEALRSQSSLNLARGPLLRVTLFDRGEGKASRLLFVVHHLGMDGVSWRVVLDDLATAYEQSRRGERVALPAKTTSFKRWAERLGEYAKSEAAREEIAYWLDESRPRPRPLPVDFEGGANLEASSRVVLRSLEAEETEALLREVPKFEHVRINDVLLTALVESFAGWTGERAVVVDYEGHGREEIAEDLDISRTVGWFTSISPILLDISGAETTGAALRAVKRQLRELPNQGIGYGLLRYLGDAETIERMRALPVAEVCFNYLGQVDQSLGEASMLRVLNEPIGPVLSPAGRSPHLLYVAVIVLEGRLHVRFKYSDDCYRAETVEALARRYMESLRGTIAHCLAGHEQTYAPSDFPVAGVTQEELDLVVARADFEGRAEGARHKLIEDVYPLSPAQEGILFHSIYAPDSGVYVLQIHCTLRGVNVAALERAWQTVVDLHPVLRTAFVWENVERPLQVVGREVRAPWRKLDWREVPEAERGARFNAYLKEERDRGFELSKAPLMRLSLIRVGEDAYKFVWSHHHLLIDGWATFHVLRDFFAAYDALSRGLEPQLAPAPPYRDYIAWLGRHDLGEAEAFWREALKGFRAPTPVGRRLGAGAAGEGYGDLRALVPEEQTEALQAFARRQRLTLNTVVQGMWALMLGHYAGTRDVVFGATAAGRPAELENVAEMVGIFINVLPLRARLEPEANAAEWLGRLQREQFEVRQFEHAPLSQLQRWAEVPRGLPLFESILSFENYPVDDSLRELTQTLDLSDVHNHSETNYPITVIVAPHASLVVRMIYDRRRFDDEAASDMSRQLISLLSHAAAHPEATLADLEALLAESDKSRELSARREREDLKRSKFMKVRPKAVSLPRELVTRRLFAPEETLPLVVEPSAAGVNLPDWARANAGQVERDLLRHGAMLFRSFDVDSVRKFEQFAAALCPELFNEYGDLPREDLGGKVYGSTPYPSDQTILFHNESSHLHRWPLRIWFYCVTAARRGGETPVADCRRIYRRLAPAVRERFNARRLMYVRNYIEGLDVSWQSFFRTHDRAAVEAYCRAAGIGFEWLGGDSLRTRKVCQAVARHPKTGEETFFNQIQLHHVSCLEPSVRETLSALYADDQLPRNVYYGDGTPIEDSLVEEVVGLYREEAAAFPWQEGDVVMLDNMIAAHARNPFEGPRKIVVAMGEMHAAESS